MLRDWLRFAFAAAAFLIASRPLAAEDIPLPAMKTVLKIGEEQVPVIVTGTVTQLPRDPDVSKLALGIDLAGLQEHMTGLLRSELNQNNRCGERLSVEQATLSPSDPAASLTANIHFEKWACAKAFGKELAKKLIAGNAAIRVRLTPVVVEHRSVKLESAVVSMDADGPLGDALRSGSLGETLREKIRSSLQATLEKAVNLEAALPPALASIAILRSVAFRDAGGGRLSSDLAGELKISAHEIHAMAEQLKAHSSPP